MSRIYGRSLTRSFEKSSFTSALIPILEKMSSTSVLTNLLGMS